MKEPSKQAMASLRKEDQQIEVSFSILTIDHSNDNEITKKIATAINLQLTTTTPSNASAATIAIIAIDVFVVPSSCDDDLWFIFLFGKSMKNLFSS